MTGERDLGLDYGAAIAHQREAHKMTREALAEAAGISPSYLYEIERGLKRPSTDVLAKIATALGMRPSEMLEYVESRTLSAPSQPPSAQAAMAPPSARGKHATWRMQASSLRAAMQSIVTSPSPAAEPAASREGGRSRPEEPLLMKVSRPERPALRQLLEVVRDLSDEDIEVLLGLARRLAGKR